MKKVLIIEKQLSERELLMQLLKKEELQLFSVEDGAGALELLKKRSFDLILSDLKGIQILKRSNRRPLGTPLIHLKLKDDPRVQEVEDVLIRPFEMQGLKRILLRLKKPIQAVIAESPQMKHILQQVGKIAQSHSNVFISGESGTGKEVVAGMIHNLSKRAKHPFICVNCAALSDTLIESEFFGHEKGAFTGALQKRMGRFELADLGSLLLDEISEIPASLQAKLQKGYGHPVNRSFELVIGVLNFAKPDGDVMGKMCRAVCQHIAKCQPLFHIGAKSMTIAHFEFAHAVILQTPEPHGARVY